MPSNDVRDATRLYDLPREHLSLQELLTQIVGNERAAAAVLECFPSYDEMTRASIPQLRTVAGIGRMRAERLYAVFGLARRQSPRQVLHAIRSPEDVDRLLGASLREMDREVFRSVLLNSKNRVIRIETVSVGTLNASIVHPREVFKSAIAWSAAALILAHNHPTGVPTPSQEDIAITKRLAKAGEIIGIQVLDHVIIGADRFASLKELGAL